MKKLKFVQKSVAVGVGSLTFVTMTLAPAFAITPSVTETVKPSPTKVLTGKALEKCNRVKAKVAEFSQKFTLVHETKKGMFGGLQEVLQRNIDRGTELGLDVSKLQADLKSLQDMLAKFDQNKSNAIAALQKVQDIQCGNSKENFNTTISQATKSVEDARKLDKTDLKNLMLQIKEDLAAFKVLLKTAKISGTPKPSGLKPTERRNDDSIRPSISPSGFRVTQVPEQDPEKSGELPKPSTTIKPSITLTVKPSKSELSVKEGVR